MTTMWTDLRPVLAACDDFRELVANRAWAEQAYLMFPNRLWRSGGKRFNMSWRAAGTFVADVRGKGETYLDFYIPYCWGTLKDDAPMQDRLAALFAQVGWTEIGEAGRAELFLEALRLIAVCERRPAEGVPDWYRAVHEREPSPSAKPIELIRQVHRLADEGKITSVEFGSVISAIAEGFAVGEKEWRLIAAAVQAARLAGEELPAIPAGRVYAA